VEIRSNSADLEFPITCNFSTRKIEREPSLEADCKHNSAAQSKLNAANLITERIRKLLFYIVLSVEVENI
jgi:hypothetical protein